MLHFAAPVALKHPKRDVTCCATAQDQSIIATGCEDGCVYVWEVSSGSLLQSLTGGHTSRVNGVSFNKDAAVLASVGEDGNLIWWFLSDPAHVTKRKLEGHDGCAITCCSFAPNFQMMASGGKDGEVILWGNLGRPIHHRLRSHTNWITTVVFNPTATILATASYDHSVVLWDAIHIGVVRVIRHHDAAVTSLAISIEGTVLASGDANGVMLLCRMSDGVCLRAMRGHEDAVNGIAFIDNLGLIISGSADETVKVWELRGKCLKSFRAHLAAVSSVAVSVLDEMLVTTGEDHFARVFPYMWKGDTADEGGR